MKPRSISDEEFERVVLTADGLVIVDFWAPWCRPCRVMGPILEDLGTEYGTELAIVTLNVDKYPEVAKDLNIVSIPTLFFFSGGKIVEKIVGLASTKFLRASIERMLPVPA